MKKRAQPSRHRGWMAMLSLLAWLARQPRWLLGLGAALGWVVWALKLKRRRIVEINLALAFPELDAGARAELTRSNLISTGRGLAELLIAWRTPAERLPSAHIVGLEYITAARASGRGVLLLTAHSHPIELGVRLLKEALALPVHALAREHNSASLQAFIDAGRRAHFGPTYLKKEVRQMLLALKGGALVAYAPDQNFNTQSAFLPFFGVPAATLISWPKMLKSTHAVALTLFSARTEQGYLLEIGPALPGCPSADPIADARVYLERLEAFVRRFPAQYLWAHRRFKKQPPGSAFNIEYPARARRQTR